MFSSGRGRSSGWAAPFVVASRHLEEVWHPTQAWAGLCLLSTSRNKDSEVCFVSGIRGEDFYWAVLWFRFPG